MAKTSSTTKVTFGKGKKRRKGKSVKDLDYSYWGMDNLQTLCSNCHRTKTADEAHNRAKDRKNKDKVKWKSFREVFGV